MNNPENLYYSEEHEWAHFTDENEVIIGITDYAQTQLGDIIYLEFPKLVKLLGWRCVWRNRSCKNCFRTVFSNIWPDYRTKFRIRAKPRFSER